MSDNKPTIRFEYEKSPLFRTIHVDGACGGPTPGGLIQIAFFSERMPIPKATEHELTEEGQVGPVIQKEGRESIYREIEINALMTVGTAKAIHRWLERHITQLEELQEKGQEETP